MQDQRRRRLLVNRGLQARFLIQAAVYWFYCLITVMLLTACWIVFTLRPESSSQMFLQIWMNCGPALIGSVLLLPLVLLDCLRASHKVAGPVHRLRTAMHELANGQLPDEIKLRDDDMVKPLVDEFNAVLKRIKENEGSWEVSA